MEENQKKEKDSKEKNKKETNSAKKTGKKHTKKDKSSFYVLIFILAVIVIIAVILVGVKKFSPQDPDKIIKDIVDQGETENGYIYNGFVFVYKGDLWHTQWQRGGNIYNLHFHYSPAHVDQIPIRGSLNKELDTSKFYITFDPMEKNISLIAVATSELGLNLVKALGVKLIPACYRNETEACHTRPIITCDNTDKGVIFVRTAETTEVLLEDNCIILQGKEHEVFKAVDKMLFDWYGITKVKRAE